MAYPLGPTASAATEVVVVGIGAVGSLVLMGFISGLTGSDFVNAEDRGQFVLEMEMAAGTSLEETSRLSEAGER